MNIKIIIQPNISVITEWSLSRLRSDRILCMGLKAKKCSLHCYEPLDKIFIFLSLYLLIYETQKIATQISGEASELCEKVSKSQPGLALWEAKGEVHKFELPGLLSNLVSPSLKIKHKKGQGMQLSAKVLDSTPEKEGMGGPKQFTASTRY